MYQFFPSFSYNLIYWLTDRKVFELLSDYVVLRFRMEIRHDQWGKYSWIGWVDEFYFRKWKRFDYKSQLMFWSLSCYASIYFKVYFPENGVKSGPKPFVAFCAHSSHNFSFADAVISLSFLVFQSTSFVAAQCFIQRVTECKSVEILYSVYWNRA